MVKSRGIEEQVVVLPEIPLVFRAPGCFGGDQSLLMDLAERKVAICEAYFVTILGEKTLDDGFNLTAIGTLIVGELHDHDRRLGISAQTIGIEAHLNPWPLQQH